MARISTGKRLRFKVFERDGFICQYCGKRPPEVILHADHIFPVSKGGKNEIENLLTACADCNLGKATFEIGNGTPRTRKNAEDLQERYDQLKAFYNLQKRIDGLRTDMVNEIEEYWGENWDGETLTTKGRASIKRFLTVFTVYEIKEAIDIATSRIRSSENAYKYMCGILHTKIKQRKQIEINMDDYNL